MMAPDTAPGAGFNRFLAHVGLFQFASCIAGVFFVAFMLRQGVPPAFIFLSMAAVFSLRFVLRPLVVELAKRLGLRGAMVAGTALSCLQYLVLARLHGVDLWLLAWVAATAVGDVTYWTLFHVMFAAVGEQAKLGRQTSLRQFISAGASILGPPIGGLLLTLFDPGVAFSVAAILRVASALPLLGISEPPFLRQAPTGAYRAGLFGALVFMTDGWNICSASMAWAMICYVGLGERFDTLGAALAAASVFGALAGFVLGRWVDLGQARRAVMINLAASVAVLLAEATAGERPALIVAAMIFAALVGGLSAPSMMPAVYAAVQDAPCGLRFQFASEGGWDCGAVLASLASAGLVWQGAPLWTAILLACPGLAIQAWLLINRYKSRQAAFAGSN